MGRLAHKQNWPEPFNGRTPLRFLVLRGSSLQARSPLCAKSGQRLNHCRRRAVWFKPVRRRRRSINRSVRSLRRRRAWSLRRCSRLCWASV